MLIGKTVMACRESPSPSVNQFYRHVLFKDISFNDAPGKGCGEVEDIGYAMRSVFEDCYRQDVERASGNRHGLWGADLKTRIPEVTGEGTEQRQGPGCSGFQVDGGQQAD